MESASISIPQDCESPKRNLRPTASEPSHSISTRSSLSLPEKSGWLQKRSHHLFHRWQRRYFVLRDKTLYYYNKPESSQPKLSINFDLVTVDLNVDNPDNPAEITLTPFGSTKPFRLRGKNETENKDWALALIYHIEASDGFRNSKIIDKPKHKFWKTPRISEEKLKEDARTGDLLLFKSKSLKAKLKRGITRSKYDYIAMILKWGNGKIGIIETEEQGVRINMWEDFMENHENQKYKRIVYRSLEFDRNEPAMENLEIFLKEVEGKMLTASPRKSSKKGKKEEDSNEEGFFCSELVASAYKAMGLLSDDIPVSNYLPEHFSSGKQLNLINAQLGPELLLDFSLA
ncbi:unnamed protein product [Blepharisma stoltei]|uniref:PH domain-containing protein n=1 Tax=Blepharisma stoltei TaxID=1481888 RepID=A0AAU9JDY7_9CILI|nr:unnamed protein product [Blepharisma stoltei]